MTDQVLRVFIGYDGRNDDAYRVCRRSLVDRSSKAVHVTPLRIQALEHMGLYRRTWHTSDGQFVDDRDGRPFSTEFSFTRFLVPALCQWEGWALFCDGDFLWRADSAELFALADPTHALMVVKHNHAPEEARKMRGQLQTRYHRKNWSSLMLFNAGHPANRYLTPFRVNVAPGQWLHALSWLQDGEIGALPEAWNWLEGHSPPEVTPKAVHFTRGTPNMPGYGAVAHADEWRAYLDTTGAAASAAASLSA
jgi:hypothetical protein